MTDTIICPACGTEITVSETLATQIRQHMRLEFDQEAKRKDGAFEKRQDDLRKKERELETSRGSIEQEVLHRVAQEQTRIAKEARMLKPSNSSGRI